MTISPADSNERAGRTLSQGSTYGWNYLRRDKRELRKKVFDKQHVPVTDTMQ